MEPRNNFPAAACIISILIFFSKSEFWSHREAIISTIYPVNSVWEFKSESAVLIGWRTLRCPRTPLLPFLQLHFYVPIHFKSPVMRSIIHKCRAQIRGMFHCFAVFHRCIFHQLFISMYTSFALSAQHFQC